MFIAKLIEVKNENYELNCSVVTSAIINLQCFPGSRIAPVRSEIIYASSAFILGSSSESFLPSCGFSILKMTHEA